MKLVNIKEYGIKGKLYYVQPNNLNRYAITSNELQNIGIDNDDVWIDEKVAKKLEKINAELLSEGLELVVKDGFRSTELYELVYEKHCALFGKDQTDKILNMERKMHATGLAVDVVLAYIQGDELPMKIGTHGTTSVYGQEQYHISFFEKSTHPQEMIMHDNRIKLYTIMKNYGFFLGALQEYWHYEIGED